MPALLHFVLVKVLEKPSHSCLTIDKLCGLIRFALDIFLMEIDTFLQHGPFDLIHIIYEGQNYKKKSEIVKRLQM